MKIAHTHTDTDIQIESVDGRETRLFQTSPHMNSIYRMIWIWTHSSSSSSTSSSKNGIFQFVLFRIKYSYASKDKKKRMTYGLIEISNLRIERSHGFERTADDRRGKGELNWTLFIYRIILSVSHSTLQRMLSFLRRMLFIRTRIRPGESSLKNELQVYYSR